MLKKLAKEELMQMISGRLLLLVVQRDLFNSPNFNSDKYISAMENAFKGNYREFKGLYNAIYSGVGQENIVWIILTESNMKKQIQGLNVIYDGRAVGDKIHGYSYTFEEELKPWNPIFFDYIRKLYQQKDQELPEQEDKESLEFGGNGVAGSIGGTVSGDSVGGVIAGAALTMMACAESEGQTFGEAGEGNNPLGTTPSGEGGGTGDHGMTPDVGPSELSSTNLFDICPPNPLDLPDSVALGPENGLPFIEESVEEFKESTLGNIILSSSVSGPISYSGGGIGTKAPKSLSGSKVKGDGVVIGYTFNFFDPEGDLGNANNCGPGFFSFLANLDCDDDTDEDCDESDNVGVFANPSQSFIDPCGGSTPADAVDVSKMQKYWYDPVPIEYVGVIDTINHEDFLTFEQVTNDGSGILVDKP
jgi:hypothetical protein